jgi:hypothetical protein
MRQRPVFEAPVFEVPVDDVTTIAQWFSDRLPPQWNAKQVEVLVDQDEVFVVVDLGELDVEGTPGRRWREETREERMALAARAEALFGRRVSWAVRGAGRTTVFSSASVPVMTRLRIGERRTLDTLIDAGIARTRSEALAWCVRLVGEREAEWIEELRAAFEAVEQVRERGPLSRRRRD